MPAKIRHEWKYFAKQNTLAYYIYDKGFIGQPSWYDFLRSNGGCSDKSIAGVSLEICGMNLFNKVRINQLPVSVATWHHVSSISLPTLIS